MLDDQILLSLLDTSAKKAMEKIKSSQAVTVEEAMPLLLKAQFNHIAHLDREIATINSRMATKEDLRQFDAKFDSIDRRFESIDRQFDKIDARFEKIDDRFEKVFDKLNTQLYWTVGTMIAIAGAAIGIIKL